MGYCTTGNEKSDCTWFNKNTDGVIASYSPSLPEFLLGLSGISVALIIVTLALKVLQFAPDSLADADVDPHYKATN